MPSTIQKSSERIYFPYVEGRFEPIRRILKPYNIATSFTLVSTLMNSSTHLMNEPPPKEEQILSAYSCVVLADACSFVLRLVKQAEV